MAKNIKNLWNLTGPSVRPVICHLKITKFLETCKSDPLMCQSDKNLHNLTGPSVIDSVSCQICQNRQDSEKFPRRMSIWPVKPDNCHLFSGDSGNLLIWNCWSSAGGKNHSSFPSLPPTLAVCLGYLLKNPLFLYIRKRLRSQGEGSCGGDYP